MTRIAPVKLTGSNQLATGEGALAVNSKRGGSIPLNLKLQPKMRDQEVL